MPGSFELPVVAKAMAKSGKYDAVVCIGVVVSGLGSYHGLSSFMVPSFMVSHIATGRMHASWRQSAGCEAPRCTSTPPLNPSTHTPWPLRRCGAPPRTTMRLWAAPPAACSTPLLTRVCPSSLAC